MKIEIQIRECKTGYIVEDSYFGEEIPVFSWDSGVKEINKILDNYKKEIKEREEAADKAEEEGQDEVAEILRGKKDKEIINLMKGGKE